MGGKSLSDIVLNVIHNNMKILRLYACNGNTLPPNTMPSNQRYKDVLDAEGIIESQLNFLEETGFPESKLNHIREEYEKLKAIYDSNPCRS